MSAVRGDKSNHLDQSYGGELPSFVAAAHELKSPLALVRQLSLMLERGELQEHDRERMLRQITLTSERALRLTTDLTRASRLQNTLFELEPVNPQQLCEDIVHELTPMYKAHGKTIRVVGRQRSMLAVANRDLLARIITNFGDNALYYAGADSAVEISTHMTNNGKFVRVGVRDYGPALSSSVWGDLTKSINQTTTQKVHARPQSSGLGLYISGQFAQAMNGSIGAIHHRDGATFYVDMSSSKQLSLL